MSFAEVITHTQLEKITEMYNDISYTRNDIATYLNIPYNSVGHVLSFYSINSKKKNKEKRHKMSETPKCVNAFNTVTPEIAYVLGYILGDGCLSRSRHRLNISSKDLHIVQDIARVINYPIEDIYKDTKIRDGKTFICYQLNSYDAPTVYTIIDQFGIGEQKSNRGCSPVIPCSYESHFLRGLFDSDGCVRVVGKKNSLYKRLSVEILGHSSYINRFINNDYSHLAFNYGKYRNKICCYMNLSKSSNIRKFYDYIYDNATIYLKRKKKVFDDHYNSRKYNF